MNILPEVWPFVLHGLPTFAVHRHLFYVFPDHGGHPAEPGAITRQEAIDTTYAWADWMDANECVARTADQLGVKDVALSGQEYVDALRAIGGASNGCDDLSDWGAWSKEVES